MRITHENNSMLCRVEHQEAFYPIPRLGIALGGIVAITLIIVGYLATFEMLPFLKDDKGYIFFSSIAAGSLLLFISSLRTRTSALLGLIGLVIICSGIVATYLCINQPNELLGMVAVIFLFFVAPIAIFLLLLASLLSFLASNHKGSNTCITCGYNLRGLTEPRCPECGTPFEPKLNDEQSEGSASTSDDDQTRP